MAVGPSKDHPLVKSIETLNEKCDPNGLRRAFSLFSKETARLEKAYAQLHEKFNDLKNSLSQKVEELHRTGNFLNCLLSHISQGLLFVNNEGVITACNPAFEKLFKIPSIRFINKSCFENFPDHFFGFSLSEALQKQVAPTMTFFSLETVLGLRDFEVTITLVNEEMERGGLLLLFRELSKVKELERALQRNDRLKELGEMAASLAHEIRNPLGGIEGFASLLKSDLREDEKKAEMAEQIIKGVTRLNRLVTRILDYAKPLTLHIHPVDLLELIRDTIPLLSLENKSPHYQFDLDTSLSSSMMLGDADLLRSALINLFLNAMQSMPKGGAVKISLHESDTSLHLVIKDHGAGIKKSHFEKLFQPFFTTKEKGNGLGLAEVHKIVQAHGGTIDVQSVLRQGTTFTLTFSKFLTYDH